MGLFLYAVSVLTSATALSLSVFGLVCAPFAALICAVKARSRSLDVVLYAGAGAAYSILFFVPLVYLIARMNNRSLPRAVIGSTYLVLYGVVWALGSITLNWLVVLASAPRFQELSIILLIANTLTWTVSLIMLLYRDSRDKEQQRIMLDSALLDNSYSDARGQLENLRRDSLPHLMYITPFALALVWVIITLILLGLQIDSGRSQNPFV